VVVVVEEEEEVVVVVMSLAAAVAAAAPVEVATTTVTPTLLATRQLLLVRAVMPTLVEVAPTRAVVARSGTAAGNVTLPKKAGDIGFQCLPLWLNAPLPPFLMCHSPIHFPFLSEIVLMRNFYRRATGVVFVFVFLVCVSLSLPIAFSNVTFQTDNRSAIGLLRPTRHYFRSFLSSSLGH